MRMTLMACHLHDTNGISSTAGRERARRDSARLQEPTPALEAAAWRVSAGQQRDMAGLVSSIAHISIHDSHMYIHGTRMCC